MGLVARKPVLGVPVKARFKPVSSATETIKKIEISPVASLHINFFKKRITKALIRLRGCAGWSAPLLFANPQRHVSWRRGPYYTLCKLCFLWGILFSHYLSLFPSVFLVDWGLVFSSLQCIHIGFVPYGS